MTNSHIKVTFSRGFGCTTVESVSECEMYTGTKKKSSNDTCQLESQINWIQKKLQFHEQNKKKERKNMHAMCTMRK